MEKQSGADEVTNEEDYPWLASVYHNEPDSGLTAPLICTAALVRERIFFTAARCIYSAKVNYTTVELKKMRLGVDAFVYPSTPSKQLFDDIGLIVVPKDTHAEYWNADPKPVPVELLRKTERNDHNDPYDWFEEWDLREHTNTVVGYITSNDKDKSQEKAVLYKLGGLIASNFLCNKILPNDAETQDYWVPCVHSCSPKNHLSPNAKCPYLIGLGHVVIDKDAKVIGIVTWNCEHGPDPGSPVGIAVPNSKKFDVHLQCAELLVTNFSKDGKKKNRDICDDEIFSKL